MSILEFARSFARFKSDLSQSIVPDHQLLHFIRFWPELKSKLNDRSYATYFDEWLAILPLVTKETIFDLSPDELEVLSNILSALLSFSKQEKISEELKLKLKLIQLSSIKKLFYLGEFEKALILSAQQAGIDHIPQYETSLLENLDSFECLQTLTDWFLHQNISLGNFLKGILDEWEAERENDNIDLAWCLFVDTNGPGGVPRGRLRKLKGLVETVPSTDDETKKNDTVTFDNQVKSPDDPLIGVVYDSLKAVRVLLFRSGFSKRLTKPYRSFYSIEDRQFTFTGDSIGLASSLIAYTQLLSGEVLREKKQISAAVGFSGGIDENGKLIPVNKDTVAYKLERAFCSHLKQIVLPEDCIPETVVYLEKLSARYPRRRLRIMGFKWLSEVVDSRDVLTLFRLGLGEFFVKKAYKRTRTAKVQIPLLAVLIYLLVCFFYPKVWIGFDRNPARINPTHTGFYVTNANGQFLWDKENICPAFDSIEGRVEWLMGDLDGDSKNEVLVLPPGSSTEFCKLDAHLIVFDHDGTLLFERNGRIQGEYPGDDSDTLHYYAANLQILNISGKKVIMTTVTADYPARSFHKFWSTDGELLGWYVQAGYGGAIPDRSLALDTQSRLLVLHVNNRLRGVGFYALYPESAYGVSPPYTDPDWDLSRVRKGNQVCYISFPKSDLSIALGSLYDYSSQLRLQADGVRADVVPGDGHRSQGALTYFIDNSFRVRKVSASDRFIEVWDSLSKANALPNPNLDRHLEDLLKLVAYWSDSGWVTEGQLRAAGK